MNRRLVILAVAACATLLAGCGHTYVVGSGRTLELVVTEYRLAPDNVRASAGELTIVVRNSGRLTHNLAVSINGQLIETTAPIWPGTTAQLALDLIPGKYLIASTLFGDQSLGAYGTLTVTG